MAKNLKLNIKNAQLAEALNIKPGKGTPSTPDVNPSPKEASSEDKNKPKATIVRRKASEDIKAEVPPTPVVVKEEVIPVKEELPPVKEIPPVVEPTPVAEPAPSPVAAEESDPAKKAKKPEVKAPVKKYETFKPFDVRDKQGLRTEDDKGWRKRRPFKVKQKKELATTVRPTTLLVRLPITLKDLCHELKLKASQVIQKLFMEGLVFTINDYLEDETLLALIGEEFGCQITVDTSEEERLKITDKSIAEEIASVSPDDLSERPPIVTFMGHVDHGKTSLIDAIRKSNVAMGEAGAITQHIGAFKCHTSLGEVTIIDTPGHEAFSVMRERGATITDVVVIVIAGDEGMKPQTAEAIKIALAANVPMVVAINKADKPDFNPDEVYRQLADKNLLPECWGGTVLTTNTSAKTGQGITELLESILLQSEMLELKVNPKGRARGTVIESELHKGLGSVATILIQNGTLKMGDALVIDQIYGRVKTMHNEFNKSLTEAPPGTPVRITGLSGLPEAGCEFIVVENEREARKLCEERSSGRKRALLKQKGEGLESLLQKHSERTERKVLNLIIRADVQGSVEALKSSLMKIQSTKVALNIISADVGEISESDIEFAAASHAAIIGFHTQVESHADRLIKQTKVTIKLHNIIYHAIDDVKNLMIGELDKVREEIQIGEAEVRMVFKSSHLGLIAGCMVLTGPIKREHFFRLFRNGEELWAGNIASLKRVKDDVKEVKKDMECGILLKDFTKVEAGDIIRSYEVTYITPELS
ncbi:MAG: translation initiation factor IF-2 [Simkaniaceae bacterium]|nr:translation initiation factor IF-2 [Simkaniaceae bacterium]